MDQQQRLLYDAKGLHHRRLSSTPIKSPPRCVLQRCNSAGSSGVTAFKSSTVNSTVYVAKVREDTLKEKVSTDDEEVRDSGREDTQESSDVSCGGSDFEKQEAMVKVLCFPAPANPPYDKRSYQDEDSCRDSASDVTQGDSDEEEESNSIHSNTEDSTVIEDKEQGRQGRVVFDDDDTWNDLEVTPICAANSSRGVSPVTKETASRMSPPERTLQRKVAASKVADLDKGTLTTSVSQEADPPLPPASQLMARLFPSLKPKTVNAPLPPPPAVTFAASECRKTEEETGETNDY